MHKMPPKKEVGFQDPKKVVSDVDNTNTVELDELISSESEDEGVSTRDLNVALQQGKIDEADERLEKAFEDEVEQLEEVLESPGDTELNLVVKKLQKFTSFDKARFQDISPQIVEGRKFIIDGDSLLMHALDSKGLSMELGGQTLHVIYIVENFLQTFISRALNFVVVFFKIWDKAWTGFPQLTMARNAVKLHLLHNQKKFDVISTNSLWSEEFKQYLAQQRPGFLMMSTRLPHFIQSSKVEDEKTSSKWLQFVMSAQSAHCEFICLDVVDIGSVVSSSACLMATVHVHFNNLGQFEEKVSKDIKAVENMMPEVSQAQAFKELPEKDVKSSIIILAASSLLKKNPSSDVISVTKIVLLSLAFQEHLPLKMRCFKNLPDLPPRVAQILHDFQGEMANIISNLPTDADKLSSVDFRFVGDLWQGTFVKAVFHGIAEAGSLQSGELGNIVASRYEEFVSLVKKLTDVQNLQAYPFEHFCEGTCSGHTVEKTVSMLPTHFGTKKLLQSSCKLSELFCGDLSSKFARTISACQDWSDDEYLLKSQHWQNLKPLTDEYERIPDDAAKDKESQYETNKRYAQNSRNAYARYQTIYGMSLEGLKYFKELCPSGFLSMQSVQKFCVDLRTMLEEESLDDQLKVLDCLKKVDYSGLNTSEEYVYRNIPWVLDALKDRGMLPALVFTYNRALVEAMPLKLLRYLRDLDDFTEDEETDIESESETENDKKANKTHRRFRGKRFKRKLGLMRGPSMLKSTGSLRGEGFTDEKMIDFIEKRLIKTGYKAQDSFPSLLRRGLGKHFAGMNNRERSAVEMLFRLKILNLLTATETLALGIHMPCKTVVVAGDSPFLNVLEFNQMSGRAGRRGFDKEGNVIFFGLHQRKMETLMTGNLPQMVGNFPLSASLILRLLLLGSDALKNYNKMTLNIFSHYFMCVSDDIKEKHGDETTLPLSQLDVQSNNVLQEEILKEGKVVSSLSNLHVTSNVCSVFAGLSGYSDQDLFPLSGELAHIRGDLNVKAVPTLELDFSCNSYALDFYRHGTREALCFDNGLHSGHDFTVLKDFMLVLKSIQTSLSETYPNSKFFEAVGIISNTFETNFTKAYYAFKGLKMTSRKDRFQVPKKKVNIVNNANRTELDDLESSESESEDEGVQSRNCEVHSAQGKMGEPDEKLKNSFKDEVNQVSEVLRRSAAAGAASSFYIKKLQQFTTFVRAQFQDILPQIVDGRKFIIDGDSLLMHALDSEGLSQELGGQTLHVIYIVENFLQTFLNRALNFVVVFFKIWDKAWTCFPQLAMARNALKLHLLHNQRKFDVITSDPLWSKQFYQYLAQQRPGFIMMSTRLPHFLQSSNLDEKTPSKWLQFVLSAQSAHCEFICLDVVDINTVVSSSTSLMATVYVHFNNLGKFKENVAKMTKFVEEIMPKVSQAQDLTELPEKDVKSSTIILAASLLLEKDSSSKCINVTKIVLLSLAFQEHLPLKLRCFKNLPDLSPTVEKILKCFLLNIAEVIYDLSHKADELSAIDFRFVGDIWQGKFVKAVFHGIAVAGSVQSGELGNIIGSRYERLVSTVNKLTNVMDISPYPLKHFCEKGCSGHSMQKPTLILPSHFGTKKLLPSTCKLTEMFCGEVCKKLLVQTVSVSEDWNDDEFVHEIRHWHSLKPLTDEYDRIPDGAAKDNKPQYEVNKRYAQNMRNTYARYQTIYVKYFKELCPSGFLSMQSVQKFCVDLRTMLEEETLEEQFKVLGCLKKVDYGSLPTSEEYVDSNITLVLDALKSRGMLPALVFSYNRSLVQSLALNMLRYLRELDDFNEDQETDIESESETENDKKANKPHRRSRGKRYIKKLGLMRGPSMFKSSGSLRGEGSTDEKMIDFIEKRLIKLGYKAHDKFPSLLRRGLGNHFGGMNNKERSAVEMLFRSKVLNLVTATGTLALGIHMPCKTVVVAGDSPYINGLEFNQMSGRAGRRGFDKEGNVVLFGLHQRKMETLMTGNLPQMVGNFPLSASLILRLLLLGSDVNLDGKESETSANEVLAKIYTLLENSLLYETQDNLKDRMKYFFSFVVQFLMRQSLLSKEGHPHSDALLLTHLHYHEPGNFAFYFLLKTGVLEKLCKCDKNGLITRDSLVNVVVVLSFLFARLPLSEHLLRRKRTCSVVELPELPDIVKKALENYNKMTLNIFSHFFMCVSNDIKEKYGDETKLPLSGLKVQSDNVLKEEMLKKGKVVSSLSILHVKSNVCSVFAGLSGNSDQDLFPLSGELVHIREDLNVKLVPTLELKFRCNSYALDFYKHGIKEAICFDNGLKAGYDFTLLKDFLLTLKTIHTSLSEMFPSSNLLVAVDMILNTFVTNFNKAYYAQQGM
ncbi:hypothetical protein FOCC_FOCC011808 [Frankliniella occidentalis]|nr:hypothetical protein FOCC_FOCC011808 [Frankliniella occidentalis]